MRSFIAYTSEANFGKLCGQWWSRDAEMPDQIEIEISRTQPTKKFVAIKETPDSVNHPPHYKSGGMEVIDVIEAFRLNFRLANSIKYILRHRAKGNPLEDLKKARWYLDREISKLEEEQTNADR